MNAHPFSIIKKNDRQFLYVSFKDKNGKYLSPVSTGKKDRDEAVQAAYKMFYVGLPETKQSKAVTVGNLSLKSAIRDIKTSDEADIVLAELKRLGWVSKSLQKITPYSQDFIPFLTGYWDWDTSKFIDEKLRKKHGIHKRHCLQQGQAITLYWEPFFQDRYLEDITYDDIDDFISYMGKKDLSAARKNIIIKAGTQAIRWAYNKGKIDKDPTRGHLLFTDEEVKRNILTPMVAGAIFRIAWKNERAKLGNMLAAITGMRCGEIQALRFQDLGKDCLYVNNAWNKVDSLKPTKNKDKRIVEVAFPEFMKLLFDLARRNPWGVSPSSFVFWSDESADMPMHGTVFLDNMRKALINIGFPKGQAAKYLFHGWRHFYTSYMIRKLDKKLLKSQTGHKTDVMVNLYSDHEIVGDRELIQMSQRETFAGLLQEKILLLEYKPNA